MSTKKQTTKKQSKKAPAKKAKKKAKKKVEPNLTANGLEPGATAELHLAHLVDVERREGREPIPDPLATAKVAADGSVGFAAPVGSYVVYAAGRYVSASVKE